MKTLTAVSAALLLCNCAPKHLYVAHETVFGLNAKVNQGRQQGQLLLGYDRDFVTVIPTNVAVPGKPSETDAMALVHCTRVEVEGIHLSGYSDFTATGDAAEIIGTDPDRIAAATSCKPLGKGE
ncbi:MAG: hypothetical protein ABJL67_15865 [Sulfitobacter sp.]